MARKAAAAAPAKLSIGDQIDRIWDERETKRVMAAELKKQDAKIDELELALLEELKALNLEGARGTKASIARSKRVKAKVEDWVVFWAWIAKTKNFHMMIKRVNDVGYREQLELAKGVPPPGSVPFEEEVLSLRTVD